jgi:hypothetical protein
MRPQGTLTYGSLVAGRNGLAIDGWSPDFAAWPCGITLHETMCCSGQFTGIAGQDTASGLEAPDWDSAQATASEEQWKRMTYPAGRILHLVPAHLVQGECHPVSWCQILHDLCHAVV